MFGLCQGFGSEKATKTGAAWLGICLRRGPIVLVEDLGWGLACQTGGGLEILRLASRALFRAHLIVENAVAVGVTVSVVHVRKRVGA